MKELLFSMKEMLINIGVLHGDASTRDSFISIALIALAAWLCDYLCRRIALLLLHIHAKIKKRSEEESEQYKKLLSSIAAIIPAVLINILLPLALDQDSALHIWIKRMCNVYIVVMTMMFLCKMLDFIYSEYVKKRVKNLPVNIIFQIIKYILIIIAIIISFSIILDKSPNTLLTGVGASAAVLSLVYKDTLVGLVSGIQLMGNKMLAVGDWITVPKCNADGIVREISLNTVKIENWDKTTVTIPPSTLLSDSFQNWRTMQEAGRRRVKRAINIDMNSVRFCTPEEIAKYRKIEFLKPFFEAYDKRIVKKEGEAKELTNFDPIAEGAKGYQESVNNLQLFTAYLEQYVKSLPNFCADCDHFIRQLAPSENGLPVEIYFFSSEIRWAKYEKIQADVLAYVLAAVNYFDLTVLQRCSGNVDEKKSGI